MPTSGLRTAGFLIREQTGSGICFPEYSGSFPTVPGTIDPKNDQCMFMWNRGAPGWAVQNRTVFHKNLTEQRQLCRTVLHTWFYLFHFTWISGYRNFGIVGHSGVFFFSLSLQIVYRHTVKPRGGLLGLADRCAI